MIIENDGKIEFIENFFSKEECKTYFNYLLNAKYSQQKIKLYGRTYDIPRLTSWYGDKDYTYSGIQMKPNPWTPELLEIKNKVEEYVKWTFNSVLLNYYRDGKDSVSWHSDDEEELGKNPTIASISFGETRKFSIKHKNKDLKNDFNLSNGSLVIMSGSFQHNWQHCIPKTKEQVDKRINLTFRNIQ